MIGIDAARRDDPATAAAIGRCGALVVVGCRLDSAAGLLGSSTLSGAAFAARVQSACPVAFLGDDAMLAGERVLGGLTTGPYNAYYGALSSFPGLGVLAGTVVMPRLFQNPDLTTAYDYTENRTMGMMWAMATSMSPVGVVIDAGAWVRFSGGGAQVGGISSFSTPVVLVDARAVTTTDVPVFRRPGRPNPVQNAALIGATLHVVRSGGALTITSVEETPPAVARSLALIAAAPNPFNPVTTIRYRVEESGGLVRLSVHDLLGREVAVLVDGPVQPGEHAVSWHAVGQASGTYLARFVLRGPGGTTQNSVRMLLIR
jgi:hypothetical protein